MVRIKNSTNPLKTCGKLCARYREFMGLTQNDVACEIGYSKENVSSFENGRNDNVIIFLWYVRYGIMNWYSVDELLGVEHATSLQCKG